MACGLLGTNTRTISDPQSHTHNVATLAAVHKSFRILLSLLFVSKWLPGWPVNEAGEESE